MAIAYIAIPEKAGLTEDKGLISGIFQIISILPGFFITALAAVSTFDRPEMDEEMPKPAPTITILRAGERIDVPLSRRLFLTYLFSYLTIISFVTAIACVVIRVVYPSVQAMHNLIPTPLIWEAEMGSEFLTVLILFYLCSSILISTLHGIYFLAERMHQPH